MTRRPTQGVPTASPDVAKAGTLVAPILDQIHKNYVDSLKAVGITATLTRDDFQQALRSQYGRQVLIEAVKAKLVPEDGFVASTEPTGYQTSHILVRVDVPENATEAEKEALFEAKKPRAQELLAKIAGGADFAATAASESEDYTSRKKDGKLDAFDKTGRSVAGTTFAPEYVAATLTLAEGAVTTDLVKTSFGWHIIRLNTITVPTIEDQLATARTEAFEAWIPTLASKYPVTYAVQPTETALPAPTTEAPVAPTAALGGYPTDTPEPAATATVQAPSPTMTPIPTKQP
jgi:parvulin-like peptidyl-prolyl isomerase